VWRTEQPFYNGHEIKLSKSGAKVIGSRIWTKILVESGSKVGLQLGTVGMGKNITKILISRVGARLWSMKF